MTIAPALEEEPERLQMLVAAAGFGPSAAFNLIQYHPDELITVFRK
jgi:hypothetical protein